MRRLSILIAGLGALLWTASVLAVDIETVTVGNPGNAADMRYNLDQRPEGYGGVDYSYNIGKFEVTAGQYCEFLNAVARTDMYGLYNTYMWTGAEERGCRIQRSGLSGSYTYSVASDWAHRPVNYVSWGDAARFANWLSNGQPTTGVQDITTTEDGSYCLNGAMSNEALVAVMREANASWVIPSEDEWYKAAYHKNDGATGNYWDYPTESDLSPGRDMADVSGNNANIYMSGSPYPIDSGKYTTVVGEFQDSASPYGTFDQGGNVWEWNEIAVYSYGSARGLRGGSFMDPASHMPAAVRNSDHPTVESDHFGFRVACIPEPASFCLLILGALIIARKRNRTI